MEHSKALVHQKTGANIYSAYHRQGRLNFVLSLLNSFGMLLYYLKLTQLLAGYVGLIFCLGFVWGFCRFFSFVWGFCLFLCGFF